MGAALRRLAKLKTPILNHVTKPLIDYQEETLNKHKMQELWWKEAPEDERGPEPLPPTRYVVKDATIESLGDLLSRDPRGIFALRDELSGWMEK